MTRQVVAMGGGGFSMEPGNPLLDDFVLGLTGVQRPRVCFLPTASGDSDAYIRRFYEAFRGGRAECAHLPLFNHRGEDVAAFLASQHVVYVGGGNTLNMLAIWREHGVTDALKLASEAGTILCGVSAGAVCWFEHAVTDSRGPDLAGVRGIGMLAGSCCPHYDGEALRRPRFRAMISSGELPPGLALDDGAAAHFVENERVEVVSSRPDARAYWVTQGSVGPLPTRYLGR